jgi:hypothetical protein
MSASRPPPRAPSWPAPSRPWPPPGGASTTPSTPSREPASRGGGAGVAGRPRRARRVRRGAAPPRARTAGDRQGRGRRPRQPGSWSAAASQAHPRAGRRGPWAATAAAACPGALASVGGGGWARGRAWPTSKRRAACARRPCRSSPFPWRSPRGPGPRRGSSPRVCPGCSPTRGTTRGRRPPAATAGRPPPICGPTGTPPRPWARPRPTVRRLEAWLAATSPRTPCTPHARHASRATGVAPRSRRGPARPPRRRGRPPSPRTPRRTRPGVRAARPSGRGPEGGRGASGRCGAASDAPERGMGVGAGGRHGVGTAATARALRATAPQPWWRCAAHRASRRGPRRSAGRAARVHPGGRSARLPRAARRRPTCARACAPARSASPRAAPPRPHARLCAGWGGRRRSRTRAPSRRRQPPRRNGPGATG